MKVKSIYVLLLPILLIGIYAFSMNNHPEISDENDVRELVLKSYVHGAFNELNPEAMRNGFHPDFAIFSAKGEDISKYPIATWADGVAKKKAKPDFDASKNQWEANFASIDVTGGAAMVKIELSHEGEHVYTDYLSLLKFDSGWKIVAKVYHKH